MTGIYTISQLQTVLTPLFSKYGIRKAVLFGSYGKGNATEKSDIDLLVDSGLKGLRFVGFLSDVQKAVGKDVDLLDVTHIQHGSPIDREIQETGVTVYEK
nr:nucleotidyltransferase domain-containing protein [uncultured Oscillibacter sp.]